MAPLSELSTAHAQKEVAYLSELVWAMGVWVFEHVHIRQCGACQRVWGLTYSEDPLDEDQYRGIGRTGLLRSGYQFIDGLPRRPISSYLRISGDGDARNISSLATGSGPRQNS